VQVEEDEVIVKKKDYRTLKEEKIDNRRCERIRKRRFPFLSASLTRNIKYPPLYPFLGTSQIAKC